MGRHKNIEPWRFAMEVEKAELLQRAAILRAAAAQIDQDMPEILRAMEIAEKHGLKVTRQDDDRTAGPLNSALS